MVTPCKDCTDRFVSCHSVCEKYKEWRTEFETVKERVVREKIKFGQLQAVRKDAIRRCLKK